MYVRLAPTRPIAQAAAGMTAASARVYAVAVHWMVSSGAPNASERWRSATLTIVMSSTDMIVPRTTTATTRWRTAGEAAAGAATPAGGTGRAEPADGSLLIAAAPQPA